MGNLPWLFCLLCIVRASLGQRYSSRFDNIDVDSILASKRILANYIKCILDAGPCTAEGREIREHIPEAITTNCEKCTEPQKKIVRKASTFIMKNRPQEWEKIRRKYDPEDKYKESFMNFINEK
nr:chemosensory protein [Semanotus bifasciatus]